MNNKSFDTINRKTHIKYTMKYPKKACLPLEEFCDFYFRSKEINLSLSKRADIAYKDAIAYGLNKIHEKNRIFDSIDDFFNSNEDIIVDYVSKALFSKELFKIYVDSGRFANDILNEYNDKKFES